MTCGSCDAMEAPHAKSGIGSSKRKMSSSVNIITEVVWMGDVISGGGEKAIH